jgi:hypothetical protein
MQHESKMKKLEQKHMDVQDQLFYRYYTLPTSKKSVVRVEGIEALLQSGIEGQA